MMDSKNLTSLISEWEGIWKGQPENRFSRSEQLLAKIGQLRDPHSIVPLLSLLADDREDNLMFSLIHLVEVFNDAVYAKEVVHALPNLWAQSPRWAKIVLMRILNSDTTRRELTKCLTDASEVEKLSITRVLRSIADSRPEFRDRVDTMLTLA